MTANALDTNAVRIRDARILADTGTLTPPGEGWYLDRIDGRFQWISPHGHYRKRPMTWLSTNCEPCYRAKLAWMCAQPEWTHEGRAGRRLAASDGGLG